MAADAIPGRPAGELRTLLRRDRWLLLGLALLAFLARIPLLGRADLWCDEILYVTHASPPSTPWDVLVHHWTQFTAIGHMPLGAAMHCLVLWPLSGMVPDLLHHALLQRIPAVLWCSLQIPLVFLLATLVAGRRTAWAATLLMTLSVFPVFFAREAYHYAPLMLWATVSFLLLLNVIKSGQLSRAMAWTLGLALAITTLAHINGVTVSIAGLLLALVCLMINRYPTVGAVPELRKLYGRLALLSAAGIAAGLPFFIKRMLNPSNQVFHDQPAVVEALHDFLGKTVWGVNLPQGVAGWLLLVCGLVAVFRRDEGRRIRIALLALFSIPFAIVLISSLHTLYSARYFNGVLALYYLILALGLGFLADTVARLARGAAWSRFVHPVLLAILLVPQVLLFLPVMYQLPAKGVNYGGISRWLNEHLQAGTPFVMESAYELRFTSGFFPTPDLVPAAPYVHGAGAAEMKRLRDSQRSFLERFPEAPFIESARTGTEPGAPYGLWEWPHQFYRQRFDLHNVPLQRMARWGIWPQVTLNRVSDVQYLTPILYNTADDIRAAAVSRGDPLLLAYPDWQVRPIQQSLYARVKGGAWGVVTTTNLTEGSVRGRFILQGALVAPEQSYDLHLKWMGQLLGTTARWGGTMWSVETGEVVVPRRDGRLEWGVPGEKAAGVQALIMTDCRFVPSTNAPAGP